MLQNTWIVVGVAGPNFYNTDRVEAASASPVLSSVHMVTSNSSSSVLRSFCIVISIRPHMLWVGYLNRSLGCLHFFFFVDGTICTGFGAKSPRFIVGNEYMKAHSSDSNYINASRILYIWENMTQVGKEYDIVPVFASTVSHDSPDSLWMLYGSSVFFCVLLMNTHAKPTVFLADYESVFINNCYVNAVILVN